MLFIIYVTRDLLNCDVYLCDAFHLDIPRPLKPPHWALRIKKMDIYNDKFDATLPGESQNTYILDILDILC